MKVLCKIRDLYQAITEYETRLEKKYNITLNETMLLSNLSNNTKVTSGEIARQLKLTKSNASKVIRSAEQKGFVKRIVGKEDRRQMFFSLTTEGKNILTAISESGVEIPAFLIPFIEK